MSGVPPSPGSRLVMGPIAVGPSHSHEPTPAFPPMHASSLHSLPSYHPSLSASHHPGHIPPATYGMPHGPNYGTTYAYAYPSTSFPSSVHPGPLPPSHPSSLSHHPPSSLMISHHPPPFSLHHPSAPSSVPSHLPHAGSHSSSLGAQRPSHLTTLPSQHPTPQAAPSHAITHPHGLPPSMSLSHSSSHPVPYPSGSHAFPHASHPPSHHDRSHGSPRQPPASVYQSLAPPSAPTSSSTAHGITSPVPSRPLSSSSPTKAPTPMRPGLETKERRGVDAEKKEIHTYQADWVVQGLAWSYRPDRPFRLAIGSFIEEYNNKVEIVQLDEDKGTFARTGTIEHPYPTTKCMFIPDRAGTRDDLLATTGDYLRLWRITETGIHNKALLSNNKSLEFCAPLTSCDWNEYDTALLGVSSVDTTCTIWNLETQTVRTQLIAHDKEVYDIAFAPNVHSFASCGADGSLRMFDLRNLEHSTIIFESPEASPLLRLSWNKRDPNYLATVMVDSNVVVVLDIRAPSTPVAELPGHLAPVNSLCWAPHSSCHLLTGGEDRQALIWDVSTLPDTITDPILAYTADGEVNTLSWSALHDQWVAITFDKTLQLLRV